MTTADLVRILAVRWYFVLLGLGLTAAVALTLHADSGIYESQVDVQFLEPRSRTETTDPSDDLVAIAGLVERQVRDSGRLEPASPEAPLSGLGEREGTLITLPNEDGQFDYSFSQPVLRVQSVGPTAAVVERQQREAITAINSVLRRLQAAEGTAGRDRVTTRLVPAVPQVRHLAPMVSRAAFIAAILGAALTAYTCVQADRLLSRRSREPVPGASEHATTT